MTKDKSWGYGRKLKGKVIVGSRPYVPTVWELERLYSGEVNRVIIPVDPQPEISRDEFIWVDGESFLSYGAQRRKTDVFCPLGHVGDTLWIRERWGTLPIYDKVLPKYLDKDVLRYFLVDGDVPGVMWRKAVALPKMFARLTLRIDSEEVFRASCIPDDHINECGIKTKAAFRICWDRKYAGSELLFARNPIVWSIGVSRAEADAAKR